MSREVLTIRQAAAGDLPALGRLGAHLVERHHGFDAKRFMAPRPQAAEGYARFLGSRLTEADTRVLVAECDQRVVGYVYVTVEPMSWADLRDACGFVHDVVVDPAARHRGVARALMQRAFDWLTQQGAPRVVLMSAAANAEAQRLFEGLGFRRTMIEFTREL